MPNLSGQATREQVQAVLDYNNAEISLLDNTNEALGSDVSLSGGGNYYWTFEYNDLKGFTSQGWYVSRWVDYTGSFEIYTQDGVITDDEASKIYDVIYNNQDTIGIALGTQGHICSTIHIS